MQRASFPFLVCLLTVLASSTSLAGPLVLDPSAQQGAQQPVRRASAQRELGGGFVEFLLGGGQRTERNFDPASAYRPYPADVGAGMVEAPGQPGHLVMDPRFVRQEVSYQSSEPAGTVIINTNERMLYLVEGQGRALRYGIGVGRPGFTWSGVHQISQKREWPDWTPPDEMLRRRRDLPRHMAGGPENPLGARALYLRPARSPLPDSQEPRRSRPPRAPCCIPRRTAD